MSTKIKTLSDDDAQLLLDLINEEIAHQEYKAKALDGILPLHATRALELVVRLKDIRRLFTRQ